LEDFDDVAAEQSEARRRRVGDQQRRRIGGGTRVNGRRRKFLARAFPDRDVGRALVPPGPFRRSNLSSSDSRGGVVAAEVALARRRAGHRDVAASPDNDELAIGAVASDGVALLDELFIRRLGITEVEVRAAVSDAVAEVHRREEVFGGAPSVEGRTAIVVDDGVATGATLRAALGYARRGRPQRLVCAVPVGPPATIDLITSEVDEVVCPLQPDRLRAVGEWYLDFAQVGDEAVLGLIKKL
jgi:predicted phosphoribosyltransferase